jgi:hypothetical protein
MDAVEDLRINQYVMDSARTPLEPQTNSSSPASSLQQEKRVRHKLSFIRRLDSSESLPSSHESIFIAEYLSPVNSEDSGYKGEPWQILNLDSLTHSPAIPNSTGDENGIENGHEPQLFLPIGNTPILYGHGTPLATIIEQKSSFGTIRTSKATTPTRSLERRHSSSDITPPNLSTTPRPQSLDRQNSASSISSIYLGLLSADDVDLRTHSHSDLSILSRNRSSRYLSSVAEHPIRISEIYAEPKLPVLPPLERPSTPPGMPSWTAAQQHRPVPSTGPRGWSLRFTSHRVQRFLRLSQDSDSRGESSAEPTSAYSSGYGIRGPWDDAPQRRAISTPILTGQITPRFRPTRSGHGIGNALELHPFSRADFGSPKPSTPPALPAFLREVLTPEMESARPLPRRIKARKGMRDFGFRVPAQRGGPLESGLSEREERGCPHHQDVSINKQKTRTSWNSNLRHEPIDDRPLLASTLEIPLLSQSPSVGPFRSPSPAVFEEVRISISLGVEEGESPGFQCEQVGSGERGGVAEGKVCWRCQMERVWNRIDGLRVGGVRLC